MAPLKPSPPPGDATTLTPTQARAGQRVGLIWMLVISLGLAVVVVAAVWGVNARRLHNADAAANIVQPAAAAPPVNAASLANPYPQSR